MNSRKPLSRRRVQTPIGPLPTDWRIKQLGENAHIKARIGWRGLGADEYTNEGPLLIAGTHIRGSFIDWASCDHISDFRYEESPEIQLQENDVIFSKDGTLGRIGIVENLPGRATINGTMMLVRPNGEVFWPRYLYYYLQGRNFRRFIKEKVSGSSVPHIFQRDIVRMLAPVPPLPEQRKIAAILSSVDDAIDKTQAVIDEVQVVKRGLMQELLTRGLPGWHTRFKQTEIGEMPEEWEVVAIGELGHDSRTTVRTGPFGSSMKTKDFHPSGVPVITIKSLGEGELYEPGLFFTSEEKAEELSDYSVVKGDLVFSRVADIGRSLAVDERQSGWLISPNLMRIRLNRRTADSRFMMYAITLAESVLRQIVSVSGNAGRPVVSSAVLRRLRVPVPPIDEQREIARAGQEMESRIRTEMKSLDLVKQLKPALMSVLLTGELRVAPDS